MSDDVSKSIRTLREEIERLYAEKFIDEFVYYRLMSHLDEIEFIMK